MKFETLAIRTQTERGKENEHSTPIFATSGFVFDSADDMRQIFADEMPGNVYSRYTNPSVREFENKMALLEGGEDAIATSTGMSAIFTTFACLLKQGDHLLMAQAVFGSTIKLMENYFQKWGVSYDMINSSDPNVWAAAMKENTKLIYIETPSNPGLQIFDLAAFGKICRERNVVFVVDNCFATPYLQQPLALGADVSIHSATKYIDGQGRVMGGVIVASKAHTKMFDQFMRNAGPTLSPFNAWVLSKSLETLAIRMDKHCENAYNLALWLEGQEAIKKVNYPFLDSHPDMKIAKKQMKQGGGIVTFELKGAIEEGKKFLNTLKMLSLSANLGDTRTIVTHPASSTHSRLSLEQRKLVGITDSMVRVSVGLEHLDDVKADILQALNSI